MGTVEIGDGHNVSRRSLSDGAPRGQVPQEGRLAGGWEVRRGTGRDQVWLDGRHLWTAAGGVDSASVGTDFLWVVVNNTVVRLDRRGGAFQAWNALRVDSVVAFAGGVAVSGDGGMRILSANGRTRCTLFSTPDVMVVSPDGALLMAALRDEMVGWNEQCHPVLAAAVGANRIGFIDSERLLAISYDGRMTTLGWPGLAILAESPGPPNWEQPLAEGPHGPVLIDGDFVFDLTTGTHIQLPRRAWVEAAHGAVFLQVEHRLEVRDPLGAVLRVIPEIDEPTTSVSWDGDAFASANGNVVVSVDGERTYRWELDAPPRDLLLFGDGSVTVTRFDGSEIHLVPGEPLPLSEPREIPGREVWEIEHGQVANQPRFVAGQPPGVVDTRTFQRIGQPVAERAALSPDGRLAAAVSDGRLQAMEVATGRVLWTVPCVGDQVEIHRTFVAVRTTLDEGKDSRSGPPTLHDAATGRVLWTPRTPPAPWEGRAPELATPAVGPTFIDALSPEALIARLVSTQKLYRLPPRARPLLCATKFDAPDARRDAAVATLCEAAPAVAFGDARPGGGEPDGRTEAVWTWTAPAEVESVLVLPGGDVLVAVGVGRDESVFVRISRAGALVWHAPGRRLLGRVGEVLLFEAAGGVEARDTTSGVVRWRRRTYGGWLVGSWLVAPYGPSPDRVFDAITGQPVDWVGAPPAVFAKGRAWVRYLGAWCDASGVCVDRDPSVTAGGPVDRARVRRAAGQPVSPSQVWAAGDGVVAIARGTEVRLFEKS